MVVANECEYLYLGLYALINPEKSAQISLYGLNNLSLFSSSTFLVKKDLNPTVVHYFVHEQDLQVI